MAAPARYIKNHWQILALCGAIFVLWPTQILFPLKMLVVFLHELSHALATLLTGGRVASLGINSFEGGQVVSYGGNRFVILSAGYLGSLVIGIALLVLAVRTRLDRAVLALLGGLMLAITALYVRQPFAVGFCMLSGAVMIATARYVPHRISDLILRAIGLTSMIYVPYDIFSDTIARSHLRSDAYMLAGEIGGTTLFWGILWLAISLATIALCLRYGLGDTSNVARNPSSHHNT